jgi:anti-sigma regulatory factor (Ser/Thr protein kinase)
MDPLTVPGTLESLDDIGRYARAAAEAAGLSRAAAYKLRLAVDEIATNIVMHAYGNKAAGEIVVRAEITPAELALTIEDTGPEYDPRTAKMPNEEDLARPLEERKVGGLGLFLTLRSVDGFDYRREDGRNKTILTMRRSAEDRGTP